MAALRRFAERRQPRTLREMQEAYYSFTNDDRYLDTPKMSAVITRPMMAFDPSALFIRLVLPASCAFGRYEAFETNFCTADASRSGVKFSGSSFIPVFNLTTESALNHPTLLKMVA